MRKSQDLGEASVGAFTPPPNKKIKIENSIGAMQNELMIASSFTLNPNAMVKDDYSNGVLTEAKSLLGVQTMEIGETNTFCSLVSNGARRMRKSRLIKKKRAMTR